MKFSDLLNIQLVIAMLQVTEFKYPISLLRYDPVL